MNLLLHDYEKPILQNFLGPTCDYSDPLSSVIATTDEMSSEEGRKILSSLGEEYRNHRKQWEFIRIVKALRAANMLQPGKRGLVFAAGNEPLISYFASLGADILATDLDYGDALWNGWVTTNQHADSLDALFRPSIISRKDFDERVTFTNADMNKLNETWFGTFDFLWTTCSVEHVGSIAKGQHFVRESMKMLKPNGIAVHTTELVLSSLESTVSRGSTVYWRRSDMQSLLKNLVSDGHTPSKTMCLKTGSSDPFDFDRRPYKSHDHVRLLEGNVLVGNHVITTVAWTAFRGDK